MTSAALAGIAIGITAALASALVLRTRRLIDLERRLQTDDISFASLVKILDDLDQDLAEYRAIEQIEMMAQVDFAVGYDHRIEPFERFLEGLDDGKTNA